MLYNRKYEPVYVKSCGFAQRTPKGVNEMTLVLLNDVNDLYMSHLFLTHVHAIMEVRQSSKNRKLR